MSETRNRQFSGKISTTSLMKMFILHLLSKGNLYGNQIIDNIKLKLNNKWEPSPGMIYPLLRDLENNGYVKSWWQEPDKKSIRYYKLTEAGFAHLERLKTRYRKPLEDSRDIIANILEEIY
jgi:DNA-binding PadR family transcriptional regulator